MLQLSSLQKDNSRLRSELEREMAMRQNLEMQLQTRDQTLASLRSQLDSRALRADSSPAPADPERLVSQGVLSWFLLLFVMRMPDGFVQLIQRAWHQ